jgi:glycosyltransferase involved in cell wall biosynthesis
MKASRHVVFVHDSNEYGGMERHMLMLMRHMDRKRYGISVLVPGYTEDGWTSPGLFVEEVRALGIPILRPSHPGGHNLRNHLNDINNLRGILEKHAVDIVHIHTNRPTTARKSTVAAWLAGVKIVLRSEHLPPSHFGVHRLMPWIVKPLDFLTDAIIVGSQSCFREQVRCLRRDARKLHCFTYGIELDRFNPVRDTRAAKLRLGFKPDWPLVCTIGRLTAMKGHTYLIQAAAGIVAEYGPVQFVIVGDGKLREQLRKQVVSMGLDAYVHFAGYQPDTRPYLASTDIAVMPTSIDEGISLAMLEFMAMGKPLVVTNDPSFEETIVHDRSGLVVPKADSAALSTAILGLLNDPTKAARLGRNALEVVECCFNIHRQIQQIMALYDSLLENRQPGR